MQLRGKVLIGFGVFCFMVLVFLFVSWFQIQAHAEAPIRWDDLTEAVIQVESSGRFNAYNYKSCATGLMQITPIALKDYNRSGAYYTNSLGPLTMIEMFDPDKNVHVGRWYLYNLMDQYKCKTLEQALCAYNWGIGHLRKVDYDISKSPRSTQRYIKKVMKIYGEEEDKLRYYFKAPKRFEKTLFDKYLEKYSQRKGE